MTNRHEVDVAIVGSGFAGLLAARELIGAGRRVTMIERGGMLRHTEQLRTRRQEVDVASARHNHESHPETPYHWDYTYGVGGSSLHWTGAVPRLLPSDFRMRSAFGIGRDWPVSYEDLAPLYREAERLLSVAAGSNSLFEGERLGAQPPHPLSPTDRLVAPLLEPFFTLPQARSTESVGGRAKCCGAAVCRLCPVDARYSLLHLLDDTDLAGQSGFELRDRTVVSRLRVKGDRVVAIEAITANDDRHEIRPNVVVLAANGLENPGILLRSGLDGPDVGRWLYDHGHRLVQLELDRPANHGHGSALITGISYAYADGDWRSDRGAQLVLPYNPGFDVPVEIISQVASGRTGREMMSDIRRRFERTLVLDTVGDDLPRRDRVVELSSRKDKFGLPLNRIRYPRDEGYAERGRSFMYEDLERRLRPLGAGIVNVDEISLGAHQLGTCYMGDGEGVVDPDQRHHSVRNLYITGGSSFPSYSPAHPTLTICALAIRLGRHLSRATSS